MRYDDDGTNRGILDVSATVTRIYQIASSYALVVGFIIKL